MQIPFVGDTYCGRSIDFDSSRSINFFPEYANNKESRASNLLVGTPGLKLFADFGNAEIRLVYNFAGNLIVVAGNNIYEVFHDGSISLPIASLPDTIGYIVAADNGVKAYGVGGNEILMITNHKAYLFNYIRKTATEISASTFPLYPSTVTFLDGYFIVTDDSMGLYVSDLYDGSSWPALATAAAISSPEPIQRVVAVNQLLIVLKQRTSEIWYNAAIATFQGCPFARTQGGVYAFGTPSPRSVAIGLDTIFFLANQGAIGTGEFVGVAMLNGYSPSIISTPSINYKISQMTNIESAFAYVYANEGHVFYVLTFPDDDCTIVYDITLKLWHEWSTSTAVDTYEVHRHLSNGYAFTFNKHLVSDYRDGKILELSSQYVDDNGTPIISIRTSPVVNDKQDFERVFINRLVVDCESGVGTGEMTPIEPYISYIADGSRYADGTTFAGHNGEWQLSHNGDPSAWLSWSNDGGHKWSGEYRAALGAMGQHGKRLSWRRLGKARNKVFRLRMVDKVKKIIIAAAIQDEMQ